MALSLKSPSPAVNWHCVFTEPGLSSDRYSISDNPIIWHDAFIQLIVIDQANLKGTRIGDAEISIKHANFIINHGNASSNNVLELIKIIKNKIKEQFDIDLKLEVKLLGFNKHELKGV